MPSSRSAVALVLALAFAGCAGSPSINTVAVKGTVMLDGKPLPTGKVTFDAGDGTTPLTFEVKDGGFDGKSTVGPKTVRVALYKLVDMPKPKGMSGPLYDKQVEQNVLPDRYSTKSKLKAEVTSGGANDFKFDVTSK